MDDLIERLREYATDPRRDIQPSVRTLLADAADALALQAVADRADVGAGDNRLRKLLSGLVGLFDKNEAVAESEKAAQYVNAMRRVIAEEPSAVGAEVRAGQNLKRRTNKFVSDLD